MAIDAGARHMANVSGCKSESWGDDGGGASGKPKRSSRHFSSARFTQVWPSGTMQNVVDAHVGGLKTAQALIIRGVDNCINSEPADVAAPHSNVAAAAGRG